MPVAAAGTQRESAADDRHGQYPERQVDVKDPSPGQLVDEEAAEQRSDQGGEPPYRSEQTLVATAIARRYQVADRGDDRNHQASAADALHEAEADELGHGPAHPAERRSGQEHHDRRLQDDLAAVEIAELAVDRSDDGRSEEIRGHDPGEVRQSSQLADAGRQRGRDDGLIEI